MVNANVISIARRHLIKIFIINYNVINVHVFGNDF